MIRTIGKYTLLEAVRNRLFLLTLVIIFFSIALNIFISEIAITESSQYALVIMASVLRVCIVFVISLFVITSLSREMSDKGIETMLSLPLPRYSYFLGKLYGFSLLSLIIIVLLVALLMCYTRPANAAIWSLSLLFEMEIIVTLSLFFLFTFRQITVAFSAVMAFYILARSISSIVLINNSPLLHDQSIAKRCISFIIECIAYALPDLERFTQSSWLIYSSYSLTDIGFVALQASIYTVLLIACALFDLYRMEL